MCVDFLLSLRLSVRSDVEGWTGASSSLDGAQIQFGVCWIGKAEAVAEAEAEAEAVAEACNYFLAKFPFAV
jgi:hypothetical protein